MSEQLELISHYKDFFRLTVEEAFGFLLRHHLSKRPSGKTFISNIKTWIRTTGSVYLEDLTDIHVENHLAAREMGMVGTGPVGAQTRKHDIKLMALLINKVSEWKQKKYVLDGFIFETLKLPFYPPTKGFRRPKTSPRRHTVAPNDFSRYCEHAHEDLKERLYFLIDLAISPADLKNLEPKHYDPGMDVIRFERHKIRHISTIEVVLPVTDRCRAIILKAVREKRRYILKWKGYETQHREQYERARWASGVYFQVGRDLRKTNLNEVIKQANGRLEPAQQIAGHTDPNTTRIHYKIETGQSLKPFINHVSTKYGGGLVLVELPKTIFSKS